MPRTAGATDAMLAEFANHVASLVDSARAEGRESALAELRALLGGGSPSTGAGRAARAAKPSPRAAAKPAAKRASTKSGKPRKNPWAGLSDEARLARVNAIRVGRGLPPKTKSGAVAATKTSAPATSATSKGKTTAPRSPSKTNTTAKSSKSKKRGKATKSKRRS